MTHEVRRLIVTRLDPRTGTWDAMVRTEPTPENPGGLFVSFVEGSFPTEEAARGSAASSVVAAAAPAGLTVGRVEFSFSFLRERDVEVASVEPPSSLEEAIRWARGGAATSTASTFLYDPACPREGRAAWINGKPFAVSLRWTPDTNLRGADPSTLVVVELRWSQGFWEWVEERDLEAVKRAAERAGARVRETRICNNPTFRTTPYFVLELEGQSPVDRALGAPPPPGWFNHPRPQETP